MISASDMSGLREALWSVRPEPFKVSHPMWKLCMETLEDYYRSQPVEVVKPVEVKPTPPVTPPRSGAATPTRNVSTSTKPVKR